MINNYKAQRNVRAELGGAVDLGHPVSLYIKEDEVKYSSENLVTNGKFQDGTTAPFQNNDMGEFGLATNPVSGRTSVRMVVDDANDIAFAVFDASIGKTYKFSFNRTIPNHTSVNDARFRLGTNAGSGDEYGVINSFDDSNQTTGVFRESFTFTAIDTDIRFRVVGPGASNSAEIYIDDVQLYEVVDHSYKLMAVNDTIPSGGINVEAVGPDLFDSNKGTFTNGSNELRTGSEITSGTLSDNTWYEISAQNSVDFTTVGAPNNNVGTVFCLTTESASAPTMTSNDKVYEIDLSWTTVGGAKIYLDSNALAIVGGSGTTSPGQVRLSDAADLNQDLVVGRTYKVDFEIKMSSGNGKLKVINGAGVTINGTTTSSTTFVEDSITFVAGHATDAKISASGIESSETVIIDNITIKEVYGYDYYNAPAYKFGIVSSVYDQSTGAMKTSGVAGDEVDVTVQGECNLIRPSGNNVSVVKDYVITKIGITGNPTDSFPASEVDGGHQNIPNSVGVITETNSSSETAKAILWQGVEFSEHFVHKNSLQVMAKCAEAITKFRPVSLYLNSNGDLICRHDDIPEQGVDANTNYTGVDPGKWGVAELGGMGGDIIPVTVAGKTTFKTDNSVPYRNPGDIITRLSEGGWLATVTSPASYAPNALGTVMEGGGAGDEVLITIFQGTPIGTITDWKRTIKVTAKAKGIVPQYRPVSLYLDENGNYRCALDNIPNTPSDFNNGIWCDFRKWGISQEAVADGEDVEIIVQGRTNVVDTKDSGDRGEFVRKIHSSGVVTTNDGTGYALSSLGIVEKESKTSDGEPGVIIIF